MKAMVVLVAGLLAGCASFNEGYQRAQAQQQARYVQQLTDTCAAYGFTQEQMAECRMRLDLMNQASADAARSRRAAAWAATMPAPSSESNCEARQNVFGNWEMRCH